MPLIKNLAFFISSAFAALLAIIYTTNYMQKGRLVAETVILNATIYTSDDSFPFAESMAIKDGRILKIGDYSSIKGLIGDDTNEINLNGKVVLPGFIDSHVHLIIGGLHMASVELGGVRSKDEFISKVKEAVKEKKAGEWILGGGWNNNLLNGEFPTNSWIDDITPQNPVWLSRMDRHMGLANSHALKIAKITKDTPNPNGGTILKDSNGEPNGLLVESALEMLLTTIPSESVQERREALNAASWRALSRGITTLVDFGRFYPGADVTHSWLDFKEVYEWADSVGKMKIRVCLFFAMQTWSQLADLIREKGRSISQWIYIGGVKAFMDGSLGSNSALFHEPYLEGQDNYGLQLTNMDWLFNATLHSDRSNLQVAIHAIGDKANDMVLDMYESTVSINGKRDRRFRIEHAQHLKPASFSRFGKENIIPSVQPEQLLYDIDSINNKIGILRAQKGSYAFNSILAGGARLAFGSDWPIVDMNPLRAIRTAIYRNAPGFENGWVPDERVSLDDALKAQTIWGAYACFLDNELGSLVSGKFADFVVLPAGSWTEFTQDISESVLATFVNGKQAYP
ncbi:hypothetical protein LUZ60_012179 [Juncus effusus]|nr:hypothetical protein LUZ60_012179 [Juncus effusus]